ncbi:MAG: DUF3251 domain-containing protein [Pseudomonadales bacterium]
MNRIAIAVAIMGIAGSLTGCKPDAETAAELTSLRSTVTEQAQVIAQLKTAHSKFASDIEKLQKEVFNLQWEDATMPDPKTAYLSVTEKGYSVAEMSVGSVLIAVRDVTSYANGVKVKIDIGNPTSATFPGLKLQVAWANAVPGTKNYDSNTYQEKEISITGDIKPGAWNTEEIVLAPAKSDQVDFISIKPSAPRVVLRSPSERK